MLNGMNHITLAVTDIERSCHFYHTVLGLKCLVKWDAGAYFSAADLWLCLSVDDVSIATDYSHFSFDIAEEDFEPFCRQLLEVHNVRQWKENRSEGQSLYLLDPDDHKLEIHVGSLDSRIAAMRENPKPGMQFF